MRPLAPLMIVSSTCRVVNQGLGVAIPALATAAVVGIGVGTVTGLGRMVGLLAGAAIVKGGFRYLEQFTGHAVAFRLLASLRAGTYRQIEPLAPAGLEDERSGDLVTRVVGDVDRVEPFFAHTIAPLIGAVVVPLLAVIGLAVMVDPIVALVFAPFPLLMVFGVPWLRAQRVAVLSAASRTENGEAAALLTDAVQGIREISVFEARDTVAGRISQRSAAGGDIRKQLARIGAARSALSDLLAGAAVVAVAAIGVARLRDGFVDLPGLAAALTVAWVAVGPARALEEIVPDLEQALAAAGRLFDLADRTPPVSDPVGKLAIPADGSIRLEDVTVRLGAAGTTALQGIDVIIPDGAFVAIVGPSGSGKSTLVELLLRFRDPDRGRVQLGGADLRNVPLSRLRADVAFVPQRPDLFFGTIADNLRLARPDATDAELWEAIEGAALGAWARSLEHGLATSIGELGDSLSGGQRQRLAIARALLRDAPVLVLDEATSELDLETEREVFETLTRERGRRTIVVVAHRFETVIDADRILVFDRSRLVESGPHSELVASGGVYAGLWRRHQDRIPEDPRASGGSDGMPVTAHSRW
jgi:thiol reductant ABC exporter CydC subunit